MAAIDDLNAAVAALGSSISTARLGNDPSPAGVEAAVTALNTLKTTVDAETAKITGGTTGPLHKQAGHPRG